MNKPSARTRIFFDNQVINAIIEKYGFSEQEAIRMFLSSETYQMFINPELEIYKCSPFIVFDMWEAERITGDPRQSQYLRSE